jgi:hypothetical protein
MPGKRPVVLHGGSYRELQNSDKMEGGSALILSPEAIEPETVKVAVFAYQAVGRSTLA